MAEQYRILRVLEYFGDAEFIRQSMEKRGVKGRFVIRGGCSIQEAILGETGELLGDMPETDDTSANTEADTGT